jgi:hypothetical protein
MKPKKKLSGDLLREALALVNKMELLKHTVEWLLEEIEKYDKQYADERVATMEWDEKEAGYKKMEELMGRVESLLRELAILDGEYDALREKVRVFYGRDRMPPIKGPKNIPPGPDDEIELI